MDKSRFLAACTTRRAGKSNGLGLRFYRTLQKHPGARCPYFALTRDSAKNIMWEVLKEQDDKFKIGAKFTDSNLTVTIPRWKNAEIKLFGADMKNFIKRIRGQKWPGVGLDECQDFGSHLESLIDDVITPSISDYADGWLALTGTPGPVPHGFFYDVTERKKYGYSHHAWSLFQNPYLPNPRQFVAEIKKKKAWQDDHPTLLREYYGQWVLDLDALVFKYDRERNHYSDLPDLRSGWEYVIGVDLGFHDSDAISVLGWHPKQNAVYLVDELVTAGQGITELATQIGAFIKKYDPMKVVMDTGGLGKKIAEEIQRRYSLPIHAAEKQRKFEYIELLNDALRTKRFFAKRESQFAQDCARVKWDQEATTLKISDTFHSDICDSVLYAFRESLHWLHEPERERPKKGSPEAFQEVEDEMEERALNIHNMHNNDDDWGSFGWNGEI